MKDVTSHFLLPLPLAQALVHSRPRCGGPGGHGGATSACDDDCDCGYDQLSPSITISLTNPIDLQRSSIFGMVVLLAAPRERLFDELLMR